MSGQRTRPQGYVLTTGAPPKPPTPPRTKVAADQPKRPTKSIQPHPERCPLNHSRPPLARLPRTPTRPTTVANPHPLTTAAAPHTLRAAPTLPGGDPGASLPAWPGWERGRGRGVGELWGCGQLDLGGGWWWERVGWRCTRAGAAEYCWEAAVMKSVWASTPSPRSTGWPAPGWCAPVPRLRPGAGRHLAGCPRPRRRGHRSAGRPGCPAPGPVGPRRAQCRRCRVSLEDVAVGGSSGSRCGRGQTRMCPGGCSRAGWADGCAEPTWIREASSK